MELKKLNLDDFKQHTLLSQEKINIKGGDATSPPPELDPEGNPVTGSNGGDIRPPHKPIIVFFEP